MAYLPTSDNHSGSFFGCDGTIDAFAPQNESKIYSEAPRGRWDMD